MWWNYYPDTINDLALKATTQVTSIGHTDKLDYEFYHLNNANLILNLEWADRGMPIEIEVDLNKAAKADSG